jgi:protoporphyrinogen/coproporphyrinogen III oxidase
MPTPPFLTLRDGMQTLTDALANRVNAAVEANAPITAIAPQPDGGYQLTFANRPPVLAGSVVITTPAATAATLLREIAPRASDHLATLRAAHAGTISLAYRTADIPRLPTGYGVVIPKREARPINAVTIASRKFDHRAPDGWTLLRVFFGGYRSPATMPLADPALLDLVTRELEHLFGVTALPAFHRIQRWSAGSPQYDLGHLDRIAAIEHALPDTIRVTGSAYRGVGIPDVIHQAWNTADHLAATMTRQPAHAVPAID